MTHPDPVHALRAAFVGLVRTFGLLESDRTPCGEPIAVSHAHALTELLDAQPLRQGELGRRLGLTKSGTSRMVAQLERKGWVARVPDDGDGRVWSLQLTDSGQRLALRTLDASLARFGTILNAIDPEQRSAVLAALETLRGAL